jgi:class 3 adenylate cyclase
MLFRSYKRQLASTALLSKEKKRSDDLLLNILPAEVAEELKEKGGADARLYDKVSVLFTDFVNFTLLAEQLPPRALVGELNECFSMFDAIIDRNGLEKIKTIGDAYMAVCGLPLADPLHAKKAVQAAIEIRDFMEDHKKRGSSLEVRIGINSGPVVAGIVGIKKFAYDIWGDTVNTAARIEQNGEAGKVNISISTFDLVKDHFICTPRGKIVAKNKGEIEMYFVDCAPLPAASEPA